MDTNTDKALSIITAAFNIVEYKAGFGRHVDSLMPAQVMRASEYAVLSETTFIFSLMFSKISICVFLLRLLADSLAKKRKYFLYLWIALLLVVNVICVGQQLGQCRPTNRLWDPTIPGKCEDPRIQSDFGYLNGGMCYTMMVFPLQVSSEVDLCASRGRWCRLLTGCFPH